MRLELTTKKPRRAGGGAGEPKLAGDFSVRYLLEILFRRKRLFIVPMLLTPVLAFLLSYAIKPSYMSSTTILMGKEDILNPLVRYDTAVSMTDWNRLGSFQKILYSRTLLEEAARKLGLAQQAKDPMALEGLINNIRANIHLITLTADSFQIGCSAPDAQMASNMVATITGLFIDRSLEGSRKEANSAVIFIQKQLSHYKGELDRLDGELQTFRKANAETLKTSQSLGGMINDYRAKLLDAELELKQEQLNEQLYAARLTGEKPMVVSQALYVQNTPYQVAYQELKIKMGNLVATREKTHPEVLKLQREMDFIVDLLEDEKKRHEATESREMRSPVYQEVSARLEDARIRVKVLEQKAAEFRRIMAEMRVQLTNVPELEREQTRLEGEVKQTRDIYETLQMKLEHARVSCEVEIEQQRNRFSIIDPPLAPLSRFKPIRKTFVIGGVAGGVALGFMLVFLLEFTDPRLVRPGEILRRSRLPLLGTLPKLYRYGELSPLPLFGWLRFAWMRFMAWMHRPQLKWLLPPLRLVDRLLRLVFAARRFVLPYDYPMDLVLPHERLQQAGTLDTPQDAALDDYIERLRGIAIATRAAYAAPDKLLWMVTSTRSGEGCSLFIENLAVVLAGDLKRPICLVDANLPNPEISRRAGRVMPGLAEVVEGRATLDDVLLPGGAPNVFVLPAGQATEYAEVLFNTAAFHALLAQLRERFALTLLEAPDLLSNTSGQLIAPATDGVLFLARLYVTKKQAVLAALAKVPAEKVIGMVVNHAEYWIPEWLYRWI